MADRAGKGATRRLALTMALAPLASCVAPGADRPAPQPVAQTAPQPSSPTPAPVQTVAPVEWQDRPVLPGQWTYRADTRGSVAAFGADGRLSLRCDRAGRRVALIGMGAAAGPVVSGVTVRTSYGAASWPAAAGSAPGQWVAGRGASDPVLDQIAYSRGKIAVQVPGQPALILPVWAELGRVVEDCRG
jgi:hypothetical protein